MEATVPRKAGELTFVEAFRRRSIQTRIWVTFVTIIIVIGSIGLLFPIVFMFITSLKTTDVADLIPILWLPGIEYPVQWSNYPDALNFMQWEVVFGNTLKVSILSMIGDTLSAGVVAYGFARFRAPGREVLFILVLATLMIPYQVRLVPEYLGFAKIGLVDTLWPLILPPWFGSAFNIFLLRQFYMSIPMDMDEAAKIDGAGPIRVLYSILLPQITPALAAVAIFSFTYNWNDFLRPLIYLNSAQNRTAAVALSFFTATYGSTPWPLLMAASLVMLLPVVALFFVAQRYFIQGIVISGVKG
ncbi:MAG TPA: carbohydrate ABC transporter permease [Chloroflexota bacterium]|nr:carbohydrate ABC transporter permease [Chloroflexota bacterium]